MITKKKEASPTKALLYCRVSGKKQTVDGTGLSSQEHRCRQYAEAKGYEVVEVFPDDVSGGGDFMNRPGMVALMRYLDTYPHENFVVIFDDLKRYARDTEFHLKLRREMKQRGATRECLNFNFEDSPEGKFFETIAAAQGDLEREQMARQNRQKMTARLEQGYWVFRAPVGYRYEKSPRGGKELVKDEPLASIVQEALEGYATGRFRSQTEVRRFLEASPEYPKDKPNGEIRPQTIVRLLGKSVYAGYVSAPTWGIGLVRGQHEPLIGLEAFERIRRRLDEGVYAATRKDVRRDFPLRGAVVCADCEKPLTSGWSKGKRKMYAYYHCFNKECDLYGKVIPRAKIEGDFKAILIGMKPTERLVEIVIAMFKNCWRQHLERATESATALKRQIQTAEKEIDQLVERLMLISNPRAIAAFEKRIGDLEREKLLADEKSRELAEPQGTFEEMFEHAMRFLSSPCKLWDSGRYELQNTVLKLMFSEHLAYDRKTGFRTPKTSLPFKVLEGFCVPSSKMVPTE